MTSPIYTICIILALFLLLLFLRTLFLRRAARQAHNAQRYNVVAVSGGGWNDGGIGAMGRRTSNGGLGGYTLPTDTVARPPATAVATNIRGGQRRDEGNGEETIDELPRYEAPPPEYDSIIKSPQTQPSAPCEPVGEASRPVQAESGDAVIQMPPVQQEQQQQQQQQQGGGVTARVGGLLGRITGR